MGLSRQWRIDGLDAMDQHRSLQLRHDQAVWRLWTHIPRALGLTPSVIDVVAPGSFGAFSSVGCADSRNGILLGGVVRGSRMIRNYWRIAGGTEIPNGLD